MASLPRADLSVSSELQTMARMRAHTRELSAKDAVWQGQLLGAAATGHVASTNLASATRPPPLPPTPVPISLPLSVSPIPHSPPLCASPVSPGEMTAAGPGSAIALGLSASVGDRNPHIISKNNIVKGKIRRKRLTKEEEAKFKPAQLTDLTGTTAARSRKMSREEHELMLHKRRLRNRESAARSRDRQRRTTADLAIEVDALLEKTRQLQSQCAKIAAESRHHHARAEGLARANQELLAQLAAANVQVQVPVPVSVPVVGNNNNNANTNNGSPNNSPNMINNNGNGNNNADLTTNDPGNAPGVPRPAIPRAVVSSMAMGMSMAMSMPLASTSQSLPISMAGGMMGLATTSSGNLALVPPHSAPQVMSTAGLSSGSLGIPQRAPGASNPALSTDTIDRLLADQPLPNMNNMTPSQSLLRIPSWGANSGAFPNAL